MDSCQRFPLYPGQGQEEVSEQHSQYMTSLPSRTSPDHHQVSQISLLLRAESPTLNDSIKTSPAVGSIIHSPIPVSKIRPAFQDQPYGEYAGHTPMSKARVAQESHVAAAPPDDHVLDVESDLFLGQEEHSPQEARGTNATGGPSGRHQSLGSVLDYKRTANWLREVLGTRDGYMTKFTERPDKRMQESSVLPEQRRRSESMLSNVLSVRRSTKNSPQSTKRNSNFDRRGFKRAVGDLERLLNEALAIASHVVDRPGISARKGRKQPSTGLRPRRRSASSVNFGSEDSVYPAPADAQETTGSMDEVELDEVARPRRPTCRHAATYSGLSRRPRLNELIQSYSGEHLDASRKSARHPDPANKSSPPGLEVAVDVPRRTSSKRAGGRPLTRADECRSAGRGSSESLHSQAKFKGPQSLTREAVMQLGPERPKTGRGRSDVGGTRGAGGPRVARDAPAAPRDEDKDEASLPARDIAGRPMRAHQGISLRRKSHVSLRDAAAFSLARSRRRQPTARDWSPVQKRFVAAVACISTALIGIILGIYAGLVPSIQYYIIDQSHVTVHGNTGCFLGLAVPTFFLWLLPLLHGRKPYILASLVLAMPLLFPQALAVNSQRLTNTRSWTSMILVSRALMGASLGLASMNFHSILTDLFGSSLMSVNPHQEVVDEYDAKRHGGGMDV